jgi:hypothetical protein
MWLCDDEARERRPYIDIQRMVEVEVEVYAFFVIVGVGIYEDLVFYYHYVRLLQLQRMLRGPQDQCKLVYLQFACVDLLCCI